MKRVLIVTGNQDAAFDLMDELQLCRGDIEVTLICSITDPYDRSLRGIDAVITDGTTRTEATDKTHVLDWFHDPETAAQYRRLDVVPVIHMSQRECACLQADDVQKITKKVINALSCH